jgi:hypothetical protein
MCPLWFMQYRPIAIRYQFLLEYITPTTPNIFRSTKINYIENWTMSILNGAFLLNARLLVIDTS